MNAEEAWGILDGAELLFTQEEVRAAIERVAGAISERLRDRYPLVMAVMGGSVFFAGHLLPLLHFPLEFDYMHASRYGSATTGGKLTWKVEPGDNVRGREVLVLDDILDGGDTLFAIRERILAGGAAAFHSAVLTNKQTGRKKPIAADFVGLELPNRFAFGCGMDVSGAWRNLPAIYAVKGS
jgi:hypoxanthine phosphoribosyltransferase